MPAPETPDRIYAIGDIHGHLDRLTEVHEKIAADLAEQPCDSHAILHIGDYVDRGPNSRGVIDFLLNGVMDGAPWICLLGNHDRMMRCFLAAPGGRDPRLADELDWLNPRLGGLSTLRSYGMTPSDKPDADEIAYLFEEAKDAVPAPHRVFLGSLRDRYDWRGWFFAHAGIAPRTPLAAQTEDDLLWIRSEFLVSKLNYGAVIVHGHTPVDVVEDHGNRIAIDTGAAYGGPLSCVVLEGARARVLGGSVLR
ncbi:MAG: metallophosphoesterase family protein [Pseudomonadota bacterium]